MRPPPSIAPPRQAAGAPDRSGAAAEAEQAHRDLEVLDTVVSRLFAAALNLHVATDLSDDATREHTAAALAYLDETIGEVREAAFTACGDQISSTGYVAGTGPARDQK